ncbi:MAG: PA-phosphatase [Chloroflexi bacterium]|nr:MAG: PA-phosphatase [Chloroflexota bacterium]
MKRVSTVLAIMVCLALLAGCAMAIDPNFQPQTGSQPQMNSPQIAPEAARWQTWVLASSDALRPPPPPGAAATGAELAELQARVASAAADDRAQITYWDAGSPSYRWIEEIVNKYSAGPPNPRVTRSFTLLNVAIYDAIIATWDAKYAYNRPRPNGVQTLIAMPNSPSYPSEHAAAAGAAATILGYLFPDEADLFAAKAEAAAQSRVLAGVNYPSDVEAGLSLGRAVGEKVIEWAMNDGADAEWTGEIPTGPGKWVGQNPVTPLAGAWRTWVIASPADYLSPPPPAYDSEQMLADLTEIKTITRTFPIVSKAMMWHSFDAAYPYWYRHVNTRLFEQRSDHDAPRAALINAALAITAYDASVACFHTKYTYWQIRPPHLDAEVAALFPVPNHPSYPAAHACVSNAIATTLGAFFPDDAEMLLAAAKEAGESRIWAGIHYRSDVEAGLALGEAVAQAVLERMNQMIHR